MKKIVYLCGGNFDGFFDIPEKGETNNSSVVAGRLPSGCTSGSEPKHADFYEQNWCGSVKVEREVFSEYLP